MADSKTNENFGEAKDNQQVNDKASQRLSSSKETSNKLFTEEEFVRERMGMTMEQWRQYQWEQDELREIEEWNSQDRFSEDFDHQFHKSTTEAESVYDELAEERRREEDAKIPIPELPTYHRDNTHGANELRIISKARLALNASEITKDRVKIHGQPPSKKSSPALISRHVDCYEEVNRWLASAKHVYGCQYEMTEQKILEKLSKIDNVWLIVNGASWIKDPRKDTEKEKVKALKYWYPRIGYYVRSAGKQFKKCGVKVFNSGNSMISLHEKWFVDTSLNSAIYGSFNITENAKRNIESVLHLRDLDQTHSESFYTDFQWLSARTVDWHTFINEEESELTSFIPERSPHDAF